MTNTGLYSASLLLTELWVFLLCLGVFSRVVRDHIEIPLFLILAGSFMKILSVIIGHDNFLYFGINYMFHTADIVWLFLLGTFCVYEIKGHKNILNSPPGT